MQQRIDLFLMRKQQDIKDVLSNHKSGVVRCFRVFLRGVWEGFGGGEGEEMGWCFRLCGVLLGDDGEVEGGGGGGGGEGEEGKVRCSDVFKRVVVELDKEVFKERAFVEWNRNVGEGVCDGFEIKRRCNVGGLVKVYLFVDHKPERYKLSNQLSRLLGLKQDCREGVFMAVWQYVKREKLQCVDDRTSVRLDGGLKTLMSPAQAARGVVKLQLLFRVVKLHLGPIDPIQLDFELKLPEEGQGVESQACYDIQVHLEDTSLVESAKAAGVFGDMLPSSPEFNALHEKHLDALEQLALHKRRRDFFECFSAGPVDFINQLVMSQTRDLKVIGGATGRNPEEERRASFYHQQWIHEAIPRYLLRKAIADASKRTASK